MDNRGPISYLIYRYNPIIYKIAAVIENTQEWYPLFKEKIDGCTIKGKIIDEKLEVIYDIEAKDWFGTVSFSSLGILTGEFYECRGKNPFDRRDSMSEVILKICKYVYGIV